MWVRVSASYLWPFERPFQELANLTQITFVKWFALRQSMLFHEENEWKKREGEYSFKLLDIHWEKKKEKTMYENEQTIEDKKSVRTLWRLLRRQNENVHFKKEAKK